MRLSICICTVRERKELFSALLTHLSKQVLEHDPHVTLEEQRLFNKDIEVLWERDNKEISVGAKRQKLLERAGGDYIMYIDDDDTVSDHYVVRIMDAAKSNPDCIGFLIHCDMEGQQKTAIASDRYDKWENNAYGFDYVRTIYHKTPVRLHIARQIGFQDMRHGEDADYSRRLKESKLLETEKFIPEQLYFYRYKHEDPKTKYGL